MPQDELDPSKLSGADLRKWFERSTRQIDEERRQLEARRQDRYFGDDLSGALNEAERTPTVLDNSYSASPSMVSADLTPATAHPTDWNSLLVQVGNPANRGLRREWEKREGKAWPTDPVTGRKFDVGHIIAKADGGKDVLDNIVPVHPDEHRAQHIRNGDYARWGRRPGIAQAFGGRVMRGLAGPLGALSLGTGLLSGRIRSDNLNNFTNDILGMPSEEDKLKALEEDQRRMNPKWKRGDPIMV